MVEPITKHGQIGHIYELFLMWNTKYLKMISINDICNVTHQTVKDEKEIYIQNIKIWIFSALSIKTYKADMCITIQCMT